MPSNIAEGVGRGSSAETARFGRIALGSVYELQTLVAIGERLGYPGDAEATDLRDRLTSLARRLSAFINYNSTRAAAR